MDAAALEYAMLAQHQHLHLHQHQQSIVYPHLVDNVANQLDSQQPRGSQAQAQRNQQQVQHFAHRTAPPAPTQPPSTGVSTMPDLPEPTSFGANSAQAPVACEIKPRLTKEQHDILESHFQKQNKPNTSTKKGFAETLNVSLDKVNNWFQNRRAKSKQDAKKLTTAQDTVTNHEHSHQQSQSQSLSAQQMQQETETLDDVDIQQQAQLSAVNDVNRNSSHPNQIPFPEMDYYNMLQTCNPGNALPSNLAINSSLPQDPFKHDVSLFASSPNQNHPLGNTQIDGYTLLAHQAQRQQNMFDSPQELNRRTLTQEQFDAFAQNGAMPPSADLHTFTPSYSHNDVNNNTLLINGLEPSELYMPIQAITDSDSTTASSVSDGSTYRPSEWTASRSSSLSDLADDSFAHISTSQQTFDAAPSANNPWASNNSSLTDMHTLDQEFRQLQQINHDRTGLTWPSEQASTRDAQATLLAQQMSHVELQTPQPVQSAQFKAPPPPSSIAARRQRPRPAALGIGSLRSQSYSGAAQPTSPGAITQTGAGGASQAQTLRRIRSSNVVSSVTQGRVQKGVPGSAQRSPLAWTFADSLSSPKALRHQSSGTLAPPTPMSPKEFAWQPPPLPVRPGSQWQNAGRQPSISETDAEHSASYCSATTVLDQNVSSPPHTPMFQQYPFLQHLGNGVIVENTPPQSAPATQTCFYNPFHPTPAPSNLHAPLSSQRQTEQVQVRPDIQQQFVTAAVPEQTSLHDATIYPQQSHQTSMSEDSNTMQMHFSTNMPYLVEQTQSTALHPAQVQYFTAQDANQTQMNTQTATGYADLTAYDSQPSYTAMNGASPPPRLENRPSSSSDFVVHEYNPPAESAVRTHEIKKYSDATPKNYTFANQGPEHFEKGKKANEAKGLHVTTNSFHGRSDGFHENRSA